MTFSETTNKREIYTTYLHLVYKNLNRNLIRKQKIDKKRFIIYIVCLLGVIAMGDNLFQIILSQILSTKGSAYQIQKTSEYALIYTISLVWCALIIFCISEIGRLFKEKNNKKRTVEFNTEVAKFADPHLLKTKYILLTYLSADDKAKHKDEIDQIVRSNPHKKVVVYIMPYRVPYIVRFDEYVFCFAVKNGKMQLLGIVSDNKDHTMPAILAQSHKVGPLMKGEEIEKNYKVLNQEKK